MLKKAILFSFAFIIQLQNLYSQETWQWQNPLPQPQDLYSVKFINSNTGIACGKNGTVCRTTDGGLTWSVNYLPLRNSLRTIYFADQQTGYIFPGYTDNVPSTPYIFKTSNSGLNWEAKNTGVSLNIESAYFVNSNTGYTCGNLGNNNGYLIKTTNSGSNWFIAFNDTNNFYEVAFPDPNNGYLLGEYSTMYKTTNAGLNWFGLIRIPVNNVSSIFFTDSLNGYAVGPYSGIYKTTNGGFNWFRQALSSGLQIYFLNSNKGWILSQSGGVSLTTNAGTNWNYFSSGMNFETYSIHFTDEMTGYIVGNYGRILKTNVGGFIWTNLSSSFTYTNLYGVHFVNNQTGFAAGAHGILIRTTNSGINWIETTLRSSWDLVSISFPNASTGYIAADSVVFKGTIFKTTDGGISWGHFPITNELVNNVFFIDPENGFKATSNISYNNGKIYKTSNGGLNWQNVFSAAFGFRNLYFINSNTGFCSARNDSLYKTTNGGNNWSGNALIYSSKIQFPSAQTGYSVGTAGTVYKTTNSGDNWSQIISGVPTSYSLRDVFFINDNVGYSIGNSSTSVGIIIKTTNGGSSWTILDSSHYVGLYGIHFSDEHFGYIVGYNGTILQTTNGGLTFVSQINNSAADNFYLNQNYPNPFNPVTVIRYTISESRFITIKVFDVLGNEVAILINEKQNAGDYSVQFDGSNYPSGVYFYKLFADNYFETRRMVLIK